MARNAVPNRPPQARGHDGIDVFRQPNEVGVSVADGDLFGEGAPRRKPRLDLIRTHLRVVHRALCTAATAPDERHGNAVSRALLVHVCADLGDDSCQFVARYVRGIDEVVVALLPVPVAAARSRGPRGPHVNHDASVRRRGRRHVPTDQAWLRTRRRRSLAFVQSTDKFDGSLINPSSI